jgi:hypothetical protein
MSKVQVGLGVGSVTGRGRTTSCLLRKILTEYRLIILRVTFKLQAAEISALTNVGRRYNFKLHNLAACVFAPRPTH